MKEKVLDKHCWFYYFLGEWHTISGEAEQLTICILSLYLNSPQLNTIVCSLDCNRVQYLPQSTAIYLNHNHSNQKRLEPYGGFITRQPLWERKAKQRWGLPTRVDLLTSLIFLLMRRLYNMQVLQHRRRAFRRGK